MKKLAFALLAATALSAPALAADLGRPAYREAPAYTTPYTNWNGFYIGANLGYGWGEFGNDGVLGGGQIGYNWQLSNNWVIGIEADLQASNAPVTDYFGTVRGRLGYSFGNALIYGTGGYAYGDTLFGSRSGVAIGGGLEYAFAPNWSAKIEYLHVNLSGFAADQDVVRVGVNYRFGGPIVASY